tara:strand:+ start:43 stop:189 length:147 start_codon:yes stop_codon:yes gene_type:complete
MKAIKEIKFRASRFKQELTDICKAQKNVFKQLKGLISALKGHKRKGRK